MRNSGICRLFALLLAATGCTAETAPIARARAPIALYLGFEEQCPQAVLAGLREEVADVMDPAGIYFDWRSLDLPADRERSASELAVVSMKGSCTMPEGIRPKLTVGPLGQTHITDGELLSFTDVDCDRIVAVIEEHVRHEPLHRRERALGKAIGRVVAHELYHMFANTRAHASGGLLKNLFGARDLLEGRPRFSRAEVKALHENKLSWLFGPAGAQTASSRR